MCDSNSILCVLNFALSLQTSALSEKATDVVSSIVSNVEQRCHCGFTSSQIRQAGFQCFSDCEDAVTYRAELHENGRATVSELVQFIEDWITEDGGVGILTQSLFVTIDGSCDVMITSRVETECQPRPIASGGPDNWCYCGRNCNCHSCPHFGYHYNYHHSDCSGFKEQT